MLLLTLYAETFRSLHCPQSLKVRILILHQLFVFCHHLSCKARVYEQRHFKAINHPNFVQTLNFET